MCSQPRTSRSLCSASRMFLASNGCSRYDLELIRRDLEVLLDSSPSISPRSRLSVTLRSLDIKPLMPSIGICRITRIIDDDRSRSSIAGTAALRIGLTTTELYIPRAVFPLSSTAFDRTNRPGDEIIPSPAADICSISLSSRSRFSPDKEASAFETPTLLASSTKTEVSARKGGVQHCGSLKRPAALPPTTSVGSAMGGGHHDPMIAGGGFVSVGLVASGPSCSSWEGSYRPLDKMRAGDAHPGVPT